MPDATPSTPLPTDEEERPLGEVVREARERRGIRQGALAAQIGMEPTLLGRCERGEREFRIRELAAVADVVGMSIDELVRAAIPAHGVARAKEAATALAETLDEAMAAWVAGVDGFLTVKAREAGYTHPHGWDVPLDVLHGWGEEFVPSVVAPGRHRETLLALANEVVGRMVVIGPQRPDAA